MKLAIAIPHTGTLKTDTAMSLIGMLKDFPYEYTVLAHEGSMLHVMRTRLVKKAIEMGFTHILFTDSDMTFQKDAVLRLIKRNKDIIGANAHRRKLPLEATVLNPKKKSGLTECEAVGTGFVLINLDVFKKLPEPWFFWGQDMTGEDYWFCRTARENGYKIWCDLDIPIGHIGHYTY